MRGKRHSDCTSPPLRKRYCLRGLWASGYEWAPPVRGFCAPPDSETGSEAPTRIGRKHSRAARGATGGLPLARRALRQEAWKEKP